MNEYLKDNLILGDSLEIFFCWITLLSSILQPQLTILQKLRNSREKYIYCQVKIKIYSKFLQLCINDNMGCKFELSAWN